MDNALAGNGDLQTFTPTQLYAGEADIVTTQATIPAALGELAAFTVMALMPTGVLAVYDKEGADGSEIAYGVLPHAIPDSASDQDTPIIIGGVLNFDLLVADSATYAVLKAAFALGNSNIVIQKLY